MGTAVYRRFGPDHLQFGKCDGEALAVRVGMDCKGLREDVNKTRVMISSESSTLASKSSITTKVRVGLS